MSTVSTACNDAEERQTFRRAGAIGWVGIWLVFLGAPLSHIWEHNGDAGRAVGIAAVVAFGGLYLALFASARLSWRNPVIPRPGTPKRLFVMLTGLAVLVVIAVPFAGSASLTMMVYLAAAAMFTFPRNVGAPLVLGLAVAAELAARTVSGWQSQQWSVSLSILFAGAAVYAARLAFGRNAALLVAREEMARMAVEEERSRMTRDLHDILGHSLTVITIKAELAGRLVGTNQARAAAEISDIERLAREALTDVRATIAGKREVSLAPEIANARGALASANIDGDMPTAVDTVPSANRELFGWAVREGVTNVLRHSKASRCLVVLDDRRWRFTTTASGPTPPIPTATAFAGCASASPPPVPRSSPVRRRSWAASCSGCRHPTVACRTVPCVTDRRIRLLIADDQALVRGALSALLELEPDLEVVAEVGRGDEVVSAARRTNPDVALLDVEMPGTDGLTPPPSCAPRCPAVGS